jgi:hypothetical protein
MIFFGGMFIFNRSSNTGNPFHPGSSLALAQNLVPEPGVGFSETRTL